MAELQALIDAFAQKATLFDEEDTSWEQTDARAVVCVGLFRSALDQHGAAGLDAFGALLASSACAPARDAIGCELFGATLELLSSERTTGATHAAAARVLALLCAQCSAREMFSMVMEALAACAPSARADHSGGSQLRSAPSSPPSAGARADKRVGPKCRAARAFAADEATAAAVVRALALVLRRLRDARSFPRFVLAAADGVREGVGRWPASWFRVDGALCLPDVEAGDDARDGDVEGGRDGGRADDNVAATAEGCALGDVLAVLASAVGDGATASAAAEPAETRALRRLIAALHGRVLLRLLSPGATVLPATALAAVARPSVGGLVAHRAPPPPPPPPALALALALELVALCGGAVAILACAHTPAAERAALTRALRRGGGDGDDGEADDGRGSLDGADLAVPLVAAARALRLTRVRAEGDGGNGDSSNANGRGGNGGGCSGGSRGRPLPPGWWLDDAVATAALGADEDAAVQLVGCARAALESGDGDALRAGLELLHAAFASLAAAAAAANATDLTTAVAATDALVAASAAPAAADGDDALAAAAFQTREHGSWLGRAHSRAVVAAERVLENALESLGEPRARADAARAHAAFLNCLAPEARLVRIRSRLACRVADEAGEDGEGQPGGRSAAGGGDAGSDGGAVGSGSGGGDRGGVDDGGGEQQPPLCSGVASLLAMRCAEDLQSGRSAPIAVVAASTVVACLSSDSGAHARADAGATSRASAGGLTACVALRVLVPLCLDPTHDRVAQYERAMGGLSLARAALLLLLGARRGRDARAALSAAAAAERASEVACVRALLAGTLSPLDRQLRARMDELWAFAQAPPPQSPARGGEPHAAVSSAGARLDAQLCFTRFQLQLSLLERVVELAADVVADATHAAMADGAPQ